MLRRVLHLPLVAAIAFSVLPAAAQSERQSQPTIVAANKAAIRAAYAPVNGLLMYYEILGRGKPMIVLHGGVTASDVFGANLQELAKSRQVIAVHLQGHGHTQDIDRPFRYEFMADDIAALV